MSMFKKYVSHDGGSAHCPECRETISKQANICPHCRSNLKENEAWQQAKDEPESLGCSAIIAFGLIGTSAFAAGVNYLI